MRVKRPADHEACQRWHEPGSRRRLDRPALVVAELRLALPESVVSRTVAILGLHGIRVSLLADIRADLSLVDALLQVLVGEAVQGLLSRAIAAASRQQQRHRAYQDQLDRA